MPPDPTRNRKSVAYWASFAFTVALWVFAASIAVAMLTMSLTGRIRGGVWLSILLSSYVLVWIASLSAHAITVWMARDLPNDVNLIALRRTRRPVEMLNRFLWPVLEAADRDMPFPYTWGNGGPWR